VEPVEQPGARYPPLLVRGDADAGLRAAARRKSSRYWLPPIAHVPLEPRAAVAQWDGDTVTIRCGVQAPFLVRQEVAQALKVPPSQVRIVVVDSGGGFGGKQRGECEVEAAQIARLAGAPVRVAWTREEEFTCSYTRPAGLVEIESGVDADGRLVAMRFANYNSGAAGITPPYEIPDYWIGFYRTRSDVRQGSYRSLAAVANAFARESHMDEWAADLTVDPVAFRLRHVTDARLREVIERTAARFGWDSATSGSGRGVGMSCNLEKDARLALFVEVDVDGTRVRVVRMVATGDFGAALNPDTLRNQMTGALIQGMGGALWEQVTFDGTRQTTRRLSHYRVPRFSDIPAMDVQIIDRRDVPSAGAGESPITLTAPALAAAVAAATGVRRRELPLMA
jgi:nicotinate dehydrogenase subunit B